MTYFSEFSKSELQKLKDVKLDLRMKSKRFLSSWEKLLKISKAVVERNSKLFSELQKLKISISPIYLSSLRSSKSVQKF
jgi:hypothetical protein